MKLRMAMVGCVLVPALGVFVAMAGADDAPTTKPAKKARLTQPWSLLASLTDEQKTQIISIHQTASDACNAIREKEEADITALLTSDQKVELDTAIANKKVQDKLRAAERNKAE